LVAEITAASSEQEQGIEQVNKAVVEMGKVVQQNAASAKENASASEEMNGQAEQMRDFVKELVALVSGNGDCPQMPYPHSRNQTEAPVYPAITFENPL
jgi:methyl-accepting chemotaxis protein